MSNNNGSAYRVYENEVIRNILFWCDIIYDRILSTDELYKQRQWNKNRLEFDKFYKSHRILLNFWEHHLQSMNAKHDLIKFNWRASMCCIQVLYFQLLTLLLILW